MSHQSARSSNVERHQRRAARARPSAHPYLRASSSLADALGGEGPPRLPNQPAARGQAAATSTTTSAEGPYGFGESFATYGASSSRLPQQNGESSRLPWTPQGYEDAQQSSASRPSARETGDGFVSLPDFTLPSPSLPNFALDDYALPSTPKPHPSSNGQNQASNSSYRPPLSSTSAYQPCSTVATQPFPLPAPELASSSADYQRNDTANEVYDCTAEEWYLEPVLDAYFHFAGFTGPSDQNYSESTLDTSACPSTHSSCYLAPQRPPVPAPSQLASRQDSHALPSASPILSLDAALTPAPAVDTANPLSVEIQRSERAFWGAVHPPLPPARKEEGCYRVPLHPGTRAFCDPITIGGALGLQCHLCPRIRKKVPNTSFFAGIDRADMDVEYAFSKADIYVHRGLWHRGTDPLYAYNSTTAKKPGQGYKLGHLVAMMVDKQYKAWHDSKFKDFGGGKDLQDLVGPDLAPNRGTEVRWEHVYVVAIRRIVPNGSEDGEFHYFPQLEIRL